MSIAPRTTRTLADRGPCSRPGCGCPEETHRHYRSGRDCGTCGRKTCPGYRPPRPRDQARPCDRCGTPKRSHGDVPVSVVLIAPGICPAWVGRRPWPARALTAARLAAAAACRNLREAVEEATRYAERHLHVTMWLAR